MASISSILTACASAVGGETLCTRSTEAVPASPASCLSTGESTAPTWLTNQISWHRKTQPCVRSWYVRISPSMAGCWPGMELFRGSPPLMMARATGDEARGGFLAAIRPVQATAIRHRPMNRRHANRCILISPSWLRIRIQSRFSQGPSPTRPHFQSSPKSATAM